MASTLLYTTYRQFLSRFFGERAVQKIPINAHFTCPVRDGKISTQGCAFCNGQSFVPSYCLKGDGAKEQIQKGIAFFQRKVQSDSNPAYLAYFQSATNTYSPLSVLRERYSQALDMPQISGIIVSTRPDCVTDECIEYLREIQSRAFVMVELGIESLDDEVLKTIGRGHDTAAASSAVARLKSAGIPVGAHLILGLPKEKEGYIEQNAKILSSWGVDVVKLHQLQIVRGSHFEKLYQLNPLYFQLFTLENYVEAVACFIESLSPLVAVDRFVSEMPSDVLIAPRWGVKPDIVINAVRQKLEEKRFLR